MSSRIRKNGKEAWPRCGVFSTHILSLDCWLIVRILKWRRGFFFSNPRKDLYRTVRLIAWLVENTSLWLLSDWLIDWIDSSPQRRAGCWLLFSCKYSCVSSTLDVGLLWFPVKKQFNKFILPEQGWSEGGMLARNCINGAASSWRGICLPGSSAVRSELCLSPTPAHRAPERWSSSSKFSGTHPRSPHLRKAKMLKATEPFYIPDLQTTADKCRSVKPPDFIPVSGF